jgi:uncharacterized protein (UPF0332 family)
MRFDWRAYLTLAQDLVSPSTSLPNDEARLRTGISRAYYAVFGTARNSLRARYPALVMPTDATIHGFIQRQFAIASDAFSHSVAQQLGRLRDLRNQADYEEVFAKLPENAEFALLCADTAFDAMDQL